MIIVLKDKIATKKYQQALDIIMLLYDLEQEIKVVMLGDFVEDLLNLESNHSVIKNIKQFNLLEIDSYVISPLRTIESLSFIKKINTLDEINADLSKDKIMVF